MVEINFLCVHKKLRSKRVAPVLIREITRRVNLQGIFQAVYTAGVVLPKPIATCRHVSILELISFFINSYLYLLLYRFTHKFVFQRYWHRSLNPKKLIEVKFSHLSRNMTMQRTLKLFKLPENTKVPGFRKLVEADIPQAHKILTEVIIFTRIYIYNCYN